MPAVTVSAPSRVLAAFSAEVRKARSFPAVPRTVLYGVVALLAAVLFAMAQTGAFLADGRAEELGGMTTADTVVLLLHYGQIIPILSGAWVIGQDIPVGPRRTAFLVTARRGRLFGVKLVTAALVALIAGILCVIAGFLPSVVVGGASVGAIPLSTYGWLIAYWVVIAVVTASLVAASRSMTFTVVPILVWTVGLSDLLAAQIPVLTGALDQAFRYVYLQGGAVPPMTVQIAAAVQVMVAVGLGAVLYARRDVG